LALCSAAGCAAVMASNYATGAALATAQNQWPTFFCRHPFESIDKFI
jgi:hypothetical protein